MNLSGVPMPSQHFLQEYTFDSTTNLPAWTKQQPGMHAAFGSTNELYFRTEVPELKGENKTWEGTGWRGERLNMQILVWSPDTLDQVRVITGDLKNEKNRVISKSNFRLNIVRYVVSNYPYGVKDATCGESSYKNLYLMPDRFEPVSVSNDQLEIPGKTIRPF
jgi:hypothetical protein